MKALEEIEKDKLSNNYKCWWCGTLFRKNSIWSDSNKRGKQISGFKENQLVFFRCRTCGNDTSLNRWVTMQ
ncbi:MAG: hypothetical protein ACXACP_12115 [Candidatus Hodarchaeales archaeon]|jgi:DNA-directed RNA polymerase subunit RPC12/RpoP